MPNAQSSLENKLTLYRTTLINHFKEKLYNKAGNVNPSQLARFLGLNSSTITNPTEKDLIVYVDWNSKYPLVNENSLIITPYLAIVEKRLLGLLKMVSWHAAYRYQWFINEYLSNNDKQNEDEQIVLLARLAVERMMQYIEFNHLPVNIENLLIGILKGQSNVDAENSQKFVGIYSNPIFITSDGKFWTLPSEKSAPAIIHEQIPSNENSPISNKLKSLFTKPKKDNPPSLLEQGGIIINSVNHTYSPKYGFVFVPISVVKKLNCQEVSELSANSKLDLTFANGINNYRPVIHIVGLQDIVDYNQHTTIDLNNNNQSNISFKEFLREKIPLLMPRFYSIYWSENPLDYDLSQHNLTGDFSGVIFYACKFGKSLVSANFTDCDFIAVDFSLVENSDKADFTNADLSLVVIGKGLIGSNLSLDALQDIARENQWDYYDLLSLNNEEAASYQENYEYLHTSESAAEINLLYLLTFIYPKEIFYKFLFENTNKLLNLLSKLAQYNFVQLQSDKSTLSLRPHLQKILQLKLSYPYELSELENIASILIEKFDHIEYSLINEKNLENFPSSIKIILPHLESVKKYFEDCLQISSVFYEGIVARIQFIKEWPQVFSILCMLTFLNHKAIPFSLIQRVLYKEIDDKSETELHALLYSMRYHSLIEYNQENLTISLDSDWGMAVSSFLAPEKIKTILINIAVALIAESKIPSATTSPLKLYTVSHLLKVQKYLETAKNTLKKKQLLIYANLLELLGSHFQHFNTDTLMAIEFLKQALSIKQKHDDYSQIHTIQLLANAYKQLRKFSEAVSVLDQGINIARKSEKYQDAIQISQEQIKIYEILQKIKEQKSSSTVSLAELTAKEHKCLSQPPQPSNISQNLESEEPSSNINCNS